MSICTHGMSLANIYIHRPSASITYKPEAKNYNTLVWLATFKISGKVLSAVLYNQLCLYPPPKKNLNISKSLANILSF